MKKLLLSLAFFLALIRPALAQDPRFPGRVTAIQVQVVADHADWNYALGEPVKFTITVTNVAGKSPIPNAPLSYTIAPAMMPAEKKSTVTAVDGTVTLEGGTMKEPGFLRCTVTLDRDGAEYRGMATAGFTPEKIRPTQAEPADFDAFWTKAKDELAKLPLDTKLTPMPEQSNDQVEVFQVNLQNVGTPPSRTSRFYGVLCVPRGPGPFPAMMIPPGAGIRKLTGQREWAERGFITLEVGIHGIPVILPLELYTSLNGALGGYPELNLDNRDRYYFRRVILGCLRADDYLAAHPKWDHKNLIAFGGSQGGYLSITTTALDPRVTACNIAFPAYCDVTGYVHGRAGGWPGMHFADPAEPGRDAKIATTAYFDAVNFARRIKVPGHYGWGYNDETCPPTSTFSAYNVITAPKTLDIFKEMGHPRVPGLTGVECEWVLKVGLRP